MRVLPTACARNPRDMTMNTLLISTILENCARMQLILTTPFYTTCKWASYLLLFLLPDFPQKICHPRWPATSPSEVSRPCLKVHACPSYSLCEEPQRHDDEHITDFYCPWKLCTHATNTDNAILHNVQVGFILTLWGDALGSCKVCFRHDTTVF